MLTIYYGIKYLVKTSHDRPIFRILKSQGEICVHSNTHGTNTTLWSFYFQVSEKDADYLLWNYLFGKPIPSVHNRLPNTKMARYDRGNVGCVG